MSREEVVGVMRTTRREGGLHATRIAGLRAGTIDFIGHPGSTQIFDINQSLSLQQTNPQIDQYPWSQRSDNCAA